MGQWGLKWANEVKIDKIKSKNIRRSLSIKNGLMNLKWPNKVWNGPMKKKFINIEMGW